MNLDVNFDTLNKTLLNALDSYINTTVTESKTLICNLLIFLHLKLFYQEFKENSHVYFQFMFDFRGRQYHSSIISTTNFKSARFYIFYGYYSQSEFQEVLNETKNTQSFKIIQKSLFWLTTLNNDIRDKISPSYFIDDSAMDSQTKLCYLTHFFIAIGVIFKSKILNDKTRCLDGYTLNNRLFFEQGVFEFESFLKNSQNYFLNMDEEDSLKAQLYFNFIQKMPDFYKKTMIGLDFSCSGHQLRILLAELVNPKDFVNINLNGIDQFVDMYSFLKVKFHEALIAHFVSKPPELCKHRALFQTRAERADVDLLNSKNPTY
jgi:hypothetical protein